MIAREVKVLKLSFGHYAQVFSCNSVNTNTSICAPNKRILEIYFRSPQRREMEVDSDHEAGAASGGAGPSGAPGKERKRFEVKTILTQTVSKTEIRSQQCSHL